MRKFRKKMKDENGNVIIEATLVLTIVMVFIFFLMMLGFYLFQYANVYIVANDTASSIASIYSFDKKEPIEGYVSKADYSDTKNTYRYITNAVKSVFSTTESEKKAKWYAYYNLNRFQYISPYEDPVVTVSFKTLSPLKTQVNVSVTAKYDFPLVTSLSHIMGTENESLLTINASASAVVTDVSEYLSRTYFYCDVMDTIAGTNTYTGIQKSLNRIIEDINKILELF